MVGKNAFQYDWIRDFLNKNADVIIPNNPLTSATVSILLPPLPLKGADVINGQPHRQIVLKGKTNIE